MKLKLQIILPLAIAGVFLFASLKEKVVANIELSNLRCEMLVNPKGIDAKTP
ncbi:MAG: hypothetical protein ICV79_27175, partial [Flavisolibacter sp.]|nr:hypothetical protein [Flavisolibacter sp.]